MMRLLSRYGLGICAAALLGGCEAYVHTDAPPPARVEVQPATPPAQIDVDVKPAPARPSVDVDVNTKPGGGVNVDVNKNP